ncbi:MAG: GtrA family protein [Butyrivibrio sp.]|jgi:putative flippase GtrA|nr:GtrA family protein [Butyrivibrio sp.]
MKKLLAQIAKFGVVGVICFFIDFGFYTLSNIVFRKTGFAAAFEYYYLIAGVIGFSISMIVNYLLSMKYVFERKDDLSRQKEFIIFFVLSLIGMGINEIVLYVGIDLIYQNWAWMRSWMSSGFAETFFKLGATGIVMIYNFISRKMFLEKKDDDIREMSQE